MEFFEWFLVANNRQQSSTCLRCIAKCPSITTDLTNESEIFNTFHRAKGSFTAAGYCVADIPQDKPSLLRWVSFKWLHFIIIFFCGSPRQRRWDISHSGTFHFNSFGIWNASNGFGVFDWNVNCAVKQFEFEFECAFPCFWYLMCQWQTIKWNSIFYSLIKQLQ